ncbi:hypothetical protein LBMAG49_19280 [Planctomycetota bacterium]|nr:3'(2'),5'-bisphosphate nucleotidase CysQ [Planctomycetota bacterium]MSR38192.1 3'(2'),5'-bisphosphate nucleotidase CysQ [Planctomycetota bacterium]GDY02599.1 hypothetical protein LBMAG49_19280 [Planctomycetota bacterium]
MSDLMADLTRIRAALREAALLVRRHAQGVVHFEMKPGHGPVTAADFEVDALLAKLLPQHGDGWLSEETKDDPSRLSCRRVWVVDPIDGTSSFIAGRPEYSISIALVIDGVPVLGGVANPASDVTIAGGPGLGIIVEGDPRQAFGELPSGALRVLCSRSEWHRGEWDHWQGEPMLCVRPMGSVAYKLALIAAGAAEATWTLHGKNEWDVAAGVALVRAAGGEAWLPGRGEPRFNLPTPLFRSFAAAGPGLGSRVRDFLVRENRLG